MPGLTREEVQPVGIRVTSDGKTVFVALGPANRVAVVDAETLEVRKYLLVGQRVWHLALTPDEKYLFTANGNSNDVSVIDVAALKAIKSPFRSGQAPLGVAVVAQLSAAAVPVWEDSHEIHCAHRRRLRSLAAPAAPALAAARAITTGPAPQRRTGDDQPPRRSGRGPTSPRRDAGTTIPRRRRWRASWPRAARR